MSFKIRRLSHVLGAEILGVDIGKPLDDKTFAQVHAAYLEHCVLVFRGQPLTREQHVAFSRRFGELSNNDEAPKDRAPGYAELQQQVNMPRQPGQPPLKREAVLWHSDRTFMCENTATATALRAIEIPDVGGDTMFANMYLAYDTLSIGMKKHIEGLYGVHPGTGRIFDSSTPERLAETKRLSPPVAQPLVRVHTETGRKALFVGEKIKQFADMTAEESEPLLEFLCKHATRSQHVYRHQWQKDDLVMWDNRCTMHKALYDYDHTQIRHLEKTTGITGAHRGGYIYEGLVDNSISVREALWRKRQISQGDAI